VNKPVHCWYAIGITAATVLAACGTTKATGQQAPPKATPTSVSQPKSSSPTTSASAQGGLNTNYDLCNTVSPDIARKVIGSKSVCSPNVKIGGFSDSRTINADWSFTDPESSSTKDITAVIQPTSELVGGRETSADYLKKLDTATNSDTPEAASVLGHPATFYGLIHILLTTVDNQATGEAYYLEVGSFANDTFPNSTEPSLEQQLIDLTEPIIQNGFDIPNNVFTP
jgi:hypothetical protein